jgi:predicted transporter
MRPCRNDQLDLIILIVLALAYIVMFFARREEKFFRIVGLLISSLMILMSALLIGQNLYKTFLWEKRAKMRMSKDYYSIPAPVLNEKALQGAADQGPK